MPSFQCFFPELSLFIATVAVLINTSIEFTVSREDLVSLTGFLSD